MGCFQNSSTVLEYHFAIFKNTCPEILYSEITVTYLAVLFTVFIEFYSH
jgi:hypothetical protein